MPPPRRILVTGAGGFVGGHLTPALQAAYPEAELFTAFFDVTDEAATIAAIAGSEPHGAVFAMILPLEGPWPAS